VPVADVKYRDHCPPHNVRLKPLLSNTVGNKGRKQRIGVSEQGSVIVWLRETQGTTEKRGWSGRTVFHGRHRRSVPL